MKYFTFLTLLLSKASLDPAQGHRSELPLSPAEDQERLTSTEAKGTASLDPAQGHRSERPLSPAEDQERRTSIEAKGSTLRGVQKKSDLERRLKKKQEFLSARDAFVGKDADESTEMQVFVKISSKAGKAKVTKLADKVLTEFAEDDLLVVSVNETIFDEILSDKDFEEVEIDGLVHGLSFEDVAPLDYRNREAMRRELLEKTPYGISMIEADQMDVGNNPVTVCIVDTGYAKGHPDLPTSVTGTSANSYSGEKWEWDEDFNGHGTHVAGTIAALSNNNKGVVGAGNIRLHITRGLDKHMSGFESDVLKAVDECIKAGAKIVSMSLGGSNWYKNSRDFYKKRAADNDVLFVAAAGNQGANINLYPASYPSIISVAAVYPWKKYWEYSNYGDQVELAGPGYRVLSTTVSASAVHSPDQSYPAKPLRGTREMEVEGTLVDCGAGHNKCNNAVWSICLMYHDITDTSKMVKNCEKGNGIGAVIFSASGYNIENWNTPSNLPVMVVSKEAGLELLSNAVGLNTKLGYTTNESDLEYTYDYISGTSMATPHVASAAALVWSHHPECNHEQIRIALARSAEDSGLTGCDFDYGFGIVQAKKAHEYLNKNGCTSGNWQSSVSGGGCRTGSA